MLKQEYGLQEGETFETPEEVRQFVKEFHQLHGFETFMRRPHLEPMIAKYRDVLPAWKIMDYAYHYQRQKSHVKPWDLDKIFSKLPPEVRSATMKWYQENGSERPVPVEQLQSLLALTGAQNSNGANLRQSAGRKMLAIASQESKEVFQAQQESASTPSTEQTPTEQTPTEPVITPKEVFGALTVLGGPLSSGKKTPHALKVAISRWFDNFDPQLKKGLVPDDGQRTA